MKVIVTLPTYNEAANIEEIIRRILEKSGDICVLVIDDKSPDGTGDIVSRIANGEKRVSLLTRRGPRGRGIAGIDGFKLALKLKADLIIEMDADLSHNPDYIPEMIDRAKNYDIVIGSRFIKGGGERGRHPVRRIVSIAANSYIRFLLGFPVYDCSSGYRCFKAGLLEKIKFGEFESKGPSIVSELLFHAIVYNNASVTEVPIIFEDRKKGKSKLNAGILFNNFFFILKLLFYKLSYNQNKRRIK